MDGKLPTKAMKFMDHEMSFGIILMSACYKLNYFNTNVKNKHFLMTLKNLDKETAVKAFKSLLVSTLLNHGCIYSVLTTYNVSVNATIILSSSIC